MINGWQRCGGLVAWLLVVVAAAVQADPTRDLPHQTFYVSFDKGLKADYAAGQAEPLAQGYALTNTPGHAGAALTYDGRNVRHARVCYDAPGNLHPSRGACSLWFKPDSDEDGRPYCRPVLLGVSTTVEGYWGCLMYWGPRFITGKTPVDRCYASLFEGSHGLHMISCPIEGRWRKGEWRHLAWVWDSRMGMKMYDNGQLVASQWGLEHGWHEVPDCPARHFSFGMFGRDFRGGGEPGYAMDEARVFDAALSAETVLALCQDKFDAPIRLEPIPEEATTRARERMGWTGADREALAPVAVAKGEPPRTGIRVAAIDESLDARRPLSHLSDGLPTSGWPHPTYGSSESGREVDLLVREPGRFNRIELDVFHAFKGRFVKASLSDPVPPRADVEVPPDRMGWRASFGQTVTARTLRLQREEGRLAEVRLWEVLATGQPLALKETGRRIFAPVGPIATQPIHRSLAGRAARQSLAEAPAGWRLSEGSSGLPPQPLALQGLTPAFFISDEIVKDLAAGAVTFGLGFASVPSESVIRLELRDPIWPARRLFQGDFRLDGEGEGQTAIAVDLPDFFVAGRTGNEPFPEKGGEVSAWQARQPLRLMAVLTPSRDMTLTHFTLTVHETDREAAIVEHDRTQLPCIREGYADSSEARAYGWHPMAYEKLFYPLTDFHRREPERPEIKAIATRIGMRKDPLKPTMPPATSGVPRWASLQLALLKRCRALCHYWIRERELPNGEVGGGLGDDTDFKDDWVNLALISDDDGKIAASIRRLADTAWTRDGMDRGFQLYMRDALHAVEEGASLQPHLLYLFPGDPVGVERSMQMCQHLDDWMGRTPTGKLHFKSWYVGGKGHIRTDFTYGEDRAACGLFLIMPSQYVWHSGHPVVANRIREWCDAWLSYLDEKDAKGEPLGLPSAVRWKTGELVGKRLRLELGHQMPDNMLVPFICAYQHTGDERYLTLHRLGAQWLMKAKPPQFGDWAAQLARLGNDEDRALLRQIALKAAFKDVADVDSIQRDPSTVRWQFIPQYLAWQLTGDKRYLEVSLACALSFLDEQMPALTWALPSTDRIPQPRETLDRMYLGGLATLRPGHGPPYPEHAVSYKGLGESVAALVTANQPGHVAILFFNADSSPREITLRFWQIPRGRFVLSQGTDRDGDDRIDDAAAPAQELVLQRGDPIRVALPPRVGYVLDLRLIEALPTPGPRPDLAISRAEVKTDRNAGHASIVVHNLGLAPAKNVVVRLVDARTGALMAEQTVPALEAPLDLRPRAVALEFVNVDTAPHGRVRVLLDPDRQIDETDEHNNSAEFAF